LFHVLYLVKDDAIPNTHSNPEPIWRKFLELTVGKATNPIQKSK